MTKEELIFALQNRSVLTKDMKTRMLFAAAWNALEDMRGQSILLREAAEALGPYADFHKHILDGPSLSDHRRATAVRNKILALINTKTEK
jgi:hypothetical protein